MSEETKAAFLAATTRMQTVIDTVQARVATTIQRLKDLIAAGDTRGLTEAEAAEVLSALQVIENDAASTPDLDAETPPEPTGRRR